MAAERRVQDEEGLGRRRDVRVEVRGFAELARAPPPWPARSRTPAGRPSPASPTRSPAWCAGSCPGAPAPWPARCAPCRRPRAARASRWARASATPSSSSTAAGATPARAQGNYLYPAAMARRAPAGAGRRAGGHARDRRDVVAETVTERRQHERPAAAAAPRGRALPRGRDQPVLHAPPAAGRAARPRPLLRRRSPRPRISTSRSWSMAWLKLQEELGAFPVELMDDVRHPGHGRRGRAAAEQARRPFRRRELADLAAFCRYWRMTPREVDELTSRGIPGDDRLRRQGGPRGRAGAPVRRGAASGEPRRSSSISRPTRRA